MSRTSGKAALTHFDARLTLIVLAIGLLLGLSPAVSAMVSLAFWLVARRLGEAGSSRATRAVAAAFDQMLIDGAVARDMSLIAIDLRGVEAGTLVDGPAAWDIPIEVVAKRLVEDPEARGARIARFAPHSFALLMPDAIGPRSLEIAEHLIVVCREPIATAGRVVHVDAVACVRDIKAGERITGEQLIRSLDASLRLDRPGGSPVTVVDDRLIRRAKMVKDVQREVRNSLDGDLLVARIQPVVDVRSDQVVGLRSGVDWTSAIATAPEMLDTISRSLGLARAIETQYLLRTISAAENLTFGGPMSHVTASVDADRLDDRRFSDQIDLLLRVCGLNPEHLLLEFSSRSLRTVPPESVGRLLQTGIDIGAALDFDGAWITVPTPVSGAIAMWSVTSRDLISGTVIIPERVELLRRDCGVEPDDLVVRDVNDAASALELASHGFVLQSGAAHGSAMGAREMGIWLEQRAR